MARGRKRLRRREKQRERELPKVVQPGQIGGWYRPLRDEDVTRIHEASLDVLERVGVMVPPSDCRDLFEQAGARVDGESNRVTIPRSMVEDALAVEAAGAQLLLLEAVPPEVAEYITKKLSIPVYSIGAGLDCDGQLLIISDLIGQFQAFTPKFVRQYANIAVTITNAVKDYCDDVRTEQFPADDHCYHMIKGEDSKFQNWIKNPDKK